MKIWLIIFLVLMVSHRLQSQKRPVVNITCLELAEPSNQQLRLSCSDPSDYHCLLDESYTQEYEACREWKWIPEGKCAYFNTYGRGNIDERNCVPKPNLTCSHGTVQFSSANNTKYTACYVKKEISTLLPVTTSQSGTQSDGGNATSVSTTSDKQDERTGHVLLIILLGSIVPTASIAVIYLIFMHLKYVPLYRKAYPIESQESSDKVRNEDSLEQQPFLKNEVEDTPKSPPTMMHENENITEARRNVTDESIVEKQPVLEIKVEGTSTSESPPTMRQDDGNIAEARRSGNSDASNPADMNESDLSEKFEDAPSSPTIIKQKDSDVSRDVQNKNLDEENSAENTSGVCIDSSKPDNKENKQELTDVFDDTVESLQRIAPPTDQQDRELCNELYNLLGTEGLTLTQDVMTATITRETGKSVETLLKNLTDQDKSKLKKVLHEESHRIIESKAEHGMSFHVSYGLHWIFLDEEKSPKSGWGNPVRETDTGTGDDVERLYRIHTIVKGISNPVTVSVESYIRLLDIMIEALTRLDTGAKIKEDYKLLSYKLESIKNPKTQTMLGKITEFVKIW